MNPKQLTKKAIAELKNYKEIKAIYLFGSRAKNTQKPLSDIDLCAITKKTISNSVKLAILSNSSPLVDISIFWSLPIQAREKVLREGKLLYCSDQKHLQETQTRTMTQFLDFKPTIEKFTKLYLGG